MRRLELTMYFRKKYCISWRDAWKSAGHEIALEEEQK